jgi:D-alanyl-D-alanine carboxypeptidase
VDLDPSSVTVYVNKEYSLPKDYRPENLVTPNVRFSITYYDERTLMRPEASKALEKLFQSAEKSGYYLTGVSAFRSYERQYKIFTNNLATKGKEHTLLYSAVPGTSEHQTGLAIDVSSEALGDRLDEGFASTPEGQWLARNSYRYGFIIRYPKDMDKEIGYAYEPWHIRYVGVPLAYYLYKNKLTLDEYYKYKPSPDFDFEKVYADILNYVAPTAKVRATPTPTVTPTVTPTPPAKKGGKGKPKGTKGSDSTDNTAILSITPVPTPVPVPSLAITGAPEDGSTGSDPSGAGDNADGSGTSSGTTDSNEEGMLN